MLPDPSPSLRPHVLAVGFLLLVVVGAVLTDPLNPARARLADSSTAGQHAFRSFTTSTAFEAGTNQGTSVSGGELRISKPVGQVKAAGRSWSYARWTSGWVRPAHPFTQLIPSWNVVTPANTAVQVQARVRSTANEVSSFKTIAHVVHPRRHRPPRQRGPPARRPRLAEHRHPDGRLGRLAERLPAARAAAAHSQQQGDSGRLRRQRGGQPTSDGHPADQQDAVRRPRARRPGVLPDDAPRPVPPVRRRRRGLVLPDLAGDDPRLLQVAAHQDQLRLGRASPTPTPGSTTSPGSSTTTATTAPATGPSTRRTPPTSPATPSSPGSPACARPSGSSTSASRSRRRSPSARASSPAPRSARPPATSS